MRTAIFAALIAGISGSSFAADRYYVPPHASDKQTQLLDDLPLTLALARCYGRYDSVAHLGDYARNEKLVFPVPREVTRAKEQTGALLVATARRERNETVALNLLVPQTFDEAGQIIDTGAPAEIYDVYWRASTDLAASIAQDIWDRKGRDRLDALRTALPTLLQSCATLQADIAAHRNIGKPREPVYRGGNDPYLKSLPVVLALSRCMGRYFYMRADFDHAAGDKPGSDYPDGFLDEWNRVAHLLTETAKRDREITLTISSTTTRWDFPPTLADAAAAGTDDGYDIDFRPDFWSIPAEYEIEEIDHGSRGDRTACNEMIRTLQGR